MNKDTLLFYMPKYYRNSKVMSNINNANAKELDRADKRLDDILDQLLIDEATWGLTWWEENYGVKIDLNKTYQERRAVVKAKKMIRGTTTPDVIKKIAQVFTDGAVDVIEENSIYNFIIEFINSNKKINFNDVENVVDQIKPAHLDYKFSMTTENIIDLSSTFKNYEIQPNMCGTFLCGTMPDISTMGVTLDGNVGINSNSISIEEDYYLAGEVLSGGNDL